MENVVTNEFIEQVKQSIEEGGIEPHLAELNEMHPADIGELVQRLSVPHSKEVVFKIDEEKAAEVLMEIDDELRGRILEEYTGKEIARELIENLDSDDAADLINELPDTKKREVLNSMKDPLQAKGLAELLIYPENTAGAIMATELVKVNLNWKVMECLKQMRLQAEKVDQVHSIYVVDDSNKLVGTLSLKKLLTLSTHTPISEVYDQNVHSVESTEDAESIARDMQKYDLVVMPVTDSLGHLLGRITIDDVVDVIREEAREDYNFASGLTEEVEVHHRVRTNVRARLPWLLIALVGGLAAASVVGQFEADLAAIPSLAFFMPLIAAMGGNVGVQSSAIIVQALASKSHMGSFVKRLYKELGVALINGLICGGVIIGASLLLGYGTLLAVTVAISLVSVIIVAALVGTFTPLALHKYNIDPAVATGPFITTTNDILGLFIYFMIAGSILGI